MDLHSIADAKEFCALLASLKFWNAAAVGANITTHPEHVPVQELGRQFTEVQNV